MPVILEAIVVSMSMLVIFGVAFLALFLLAITMLPIERTLSEIVWSANASKKPSQTPAKESFREYNRKR